jgi:hypothetical protein
MEHDDLPPDELLADLEVSGGDQPEQPAATEGPIVPPVDLPDEGERFELPDLPDLPDLDGPDGDFDPPDVAEAVDLVDDLDPGQAPAAPEATAPEAPVDLDLDGDLDAGEAGDAPPAPGDVDLSLDPGEDAVDPDGTDGRADDGDAGPVDLSLTEDGSFLDVAAGNAWVTGGLIAAGLAALGASVPALLRLGRATPPDLAAHLDELGIDARVEHLDLTGLQELLDEGRPVLLSTDGTAGLEVDAVLQLQGIDRANDRLEVTAADGSRSSVPLAAFETAWSDSAHQVVVAAGGEGGVALVPVVLGQRDLEPAR